MGRLYSRLSEQAPVALFDPDGIAPALLALYPNVPPLAGIFVQDVREVGTERTGRLCRPLSEIGCSGARSVLIAAFDTARMEERIAAPIPA